jgi:hypothetical protein
MLQEQTLDLLNAMKLFGMAKGFSQRLGDPKHGELSHADFLGLLVQDEKDWRDNARLKRLLRIPVKSSHGSGANPATVPGQAQPVSERSDAEPFVV